MSIPKSRSRARRPIAVLAALLAVAGAARADAPTLAQHLEQKAPTVVCVKLVVKVHISIGGQSMDDEQRTEVRAVMVDPSGLVMLYDASDQIRAFTRRNPGASATVTPTSIQILFGNEAKEHEAVLVVRDTILGLAFVQIVDMEGLKPGAVDFAAGVEPRIGQALFGVTRLERSFDCAPEIARLYVSMPVQQPRPMWGVTGDFMAIGLPAYEMGGKPVGVLSIQEGSEGAAEGGRRPDRGVFLLPLSVVAKSVEAAKKRVPEAIEKAKAAKEAAKEPEPAPAMDGEPSMGEPPAPPSEPDKPK